MFYLYFLVMVLVHRDFTVSSQCPDQYRRFSQSHTYCLSKNPKCTIISSGLYQKDKEEILTEHNKYRSYVATGKETRAGGMPSAADMMEMVWDSELAVLSQKWADQCTFEHDCSDCKKVPSYSVGQNLGYRQWTSLKGDFKNDDKSNPRNWTGVIEMFINEITLFNKKFVTSYKFSLGYGHLSQIIWAKTWRIGCGYAAHVQGNSYRQLYVCDYGPGGNFVSEPVYTVGKICSKCPSNTCCGSSCKGKSYPGLCRLNSEEHTPMYGNPKDYIFFCDFRKDCNTYSTGQGKWTIKTLNSGNVLSIVLQGGESSTMHFRQTFPLSINQFCMLLKFRKGANVAGEPIANSLSADFDVVGSELIKIPITPSSNDISTMKLSLGWKMKSFAITFSVPSGAKPQYLEIQSISVNKGKCSKVK